MNAVAAISIVAAALGLGLGSWRWIRGLSSELGAVRVAALALASSIGAFATVVSIVARAAGAFDPGLIAAGLLGLGVGLSSIWVRPGERAQDVDRATGGWLFFAVLAMGALHAYIAFEYQIHDERQIFGHKSMLEQLRHGSYPIYFPPLPAYEARYHYGFDLFSGAIARAFGGSSDLMIDLVSVAMAISMSLLAAAVVIDAGRPRSAPFAAVAIHLGAGLAWLLLAGVEGRHPRCLIQYYHPSCGVELFPTQLLNVFQHPVAIGVSLFLAMVLVSRQLLECKTRWLGFALPLIAIYAGLAIGQIVYFALVGLAIVSILPIWAQRAAAFSGRRRVGLGVLVLVGALAIGLGLAWLEGGMLAPPSVIDPGLIHFRRELGFPADVGWYERVVHHVVNLGLPFLFYPLVVIIVLWRRNFTSLVLASFAYGGLLIPHIWNYARSWDIVKFPSAAAFALSVLFAIEIDGRLSSLGYPLSWLRRGLRVLVVGGGVVAATYLIVPMPRETQPYARADDFGDPVVAQVIDWLWAHGYRKDEVVYAQSNIARELAVFGGLSIVGVDYDLQTLGLQRDILVGQKRLYQSIHSRMDDRDLKQAGVAWIVLSQEELARLGPVAKSRLEPGRDPRFALVATIEAQPESRSRRIWRVQLDADE